MTLARRLAGISAVPPTPFDDEGALDEPALRRLVERVAAAGMAAVVPCGNTGEQSSLTAAEADRVIACTVEAAAGRLAILAGVGGDLRSAVALARAAMVRGADGVMVHHLGHPFVTAAGAVRYYETLAEETGAPLVPYVRGAGLPDAVIERLVAHPAVVAIKYAVPDLLAFAGHVHAHPDGVVWLCGLAELWAPFFWLAGARGFTSGLVTVDPDPSLAMLEALRREDYGEAMAIRAAVAPFEELRARHGGGNNVPVVKEALALQGIAGATVRPPLSPLGPADAAELRRLVAPALT